MAGRASKRQRTGTKSLHTFFSSAPEQRWQRAESLVKAEEDDAIVDDDEDDAILPPPPRPRFVPAIIKATLRPWADEYGPGNLDELAVHKKKVGDVQKWLTDVLSGRNKQRVLVLKGPAGCGKTSTLSLLAKNLGVNLVFWQNPTVSEAGVTTSLALQFTEFLNRSGGFSTLTFDDGVSNSESVQSSATKRVLVIEEFPTMQSLVALDSFRSVLLQYLARVDHGHSAFGSSRISPTDGHPPVILIVSETLLSSSTAFSDSFTAHRLLGPELMNHPLVSVMEFNPVAPTFVTKALELVIKKEARDSKRRRTPGPAVVQRLADMGDLRSAVNSLEFLCVRGDGDADWSGTVAAKTKRASKDSVPLTEMEKNSLELVSRRETTLDMFHAAGKVVYNKREDPRLLDPRAKPPVRPPDHLMYMYTPKVSQVEIEALFNETGTDVQTFISTLHENYILSCTGDTFVDDLDSCATVLSDADLISHLETSFRVATQGLLFNLPHPVNRGTGNTNGPLRSGKRDAYKMFYPASLRLWRPMEEIDGLITSIFRNPAVSNSISQSKSSVASWKAKSAIPYSPTTDEDILIKRPDSRETLTLEILPFLTKIHPSPALSKITQFHGLLSTSQDEADDVLELAKRSAAVWRPNSTPREGRTEGGTEPGSANKNGVADTMDKLYISEDDIQDSE